METIYITGHRNPDLDSICASTAYAILKNLTRPGTHHQPIRSGNLSDTLKQQLELIGIEVPPYFNDIYPKVRDVMMLPDDKFEANDPIFNLFQTYNRNKPSVVPVYEDGKFFALLSVDDITSWFLKDNSVENPIYQLCIDNIKKIIPGRLLHQGESPNFEGSLFVGASSIEKFRKTLVSPQSKVVVTGLRPEFIQHAVEKQVPAIILTLISPNDHIDIDFSAYKGWVYTTELGTSETLRRMRMSQSIKSIISTEVPSIQANDRFDEAKEIFATSRRCRGIAVFEGENFAGFVTRRCFLKTPSNKVILVDHNEKAQSIKGIESATIMEIIDHHRLDAITTELPIFIYAKPVGSSCTLVYEQFLLNGLTPEPQAAKVMLTGIIADTLILKSPTTTNRDILAAEKLAVLAQIDDLQAFGTALLSITANLSTADPKKAIKSDFKTYTSAGVRIGIGQCEVTTLSDVPKYAQKYLAELEEIRKSSDMDWTVLMITDVLSEHSILLSTSFKATRRLPYERIDEGIFDMPSVMSRKKQLLPTMIYAIEG